MKIIVIGHGMVGHKFLETLADSGATDLQVTILCEEPRPAYDRVHLSEFFAGKSAEDLSLVAPGFFAPGHGSVQFDLHLNAKAQMVDLAGKTVTANIAGKIEMLSYDKLVLATGSYPFVPTVPGNQRKDCFVYRTIEDLEAMLECGNCAKTGVVIGGGLLGLECAKALRDLKLETHVVECAPRLMAVQVDESGGRILRQKIEALGVTAHTQKNTVEIVDGKHATHRMNFEDGSHLETDMIVFSAGIRPRDELAREMGLQVGERGGIVIDNHCLTSNPHVYAIGECALWNGRIFGPVAPGYDMARIAAVHVLAHRESSDAVPALTTTLAQSAGLHCERAIVVDDTLQTYDPRVYAVGECVQHRRATFGLVAPIWDQARVAAAHLAGAGHRRYVQQATATKLKVTGVDLYSAGDFIGDAESEDLVLRDPRRGVYKRLILKGSQLIGAVLYGDVKDGPWYFDLIQQRTDIAAIRHKLVFGQALCTPAAA